MSSQPRVVTECGSLRSAMGTDAAQDCRALRGESRIGELTVYVSWWFFRSRCTMAGYPHIWQDFCHKTNKSVREVFKYKYLGG